MPTYNEPTTTKKNVQNFSDYARETVEQTKEDIRDVAEKAGRSLRSFVSDSKNEIGHAAETAKTAIRNKPVQSSLIALGAGFVLGMLLRR